MTIGEREKLTHLAVVDAIESIDRALIILRVGVHPAILLPMDASMFKKMLEDLDGLTKSLDRQKREYLQIERERP